MWVIHHCLAVTGTCDPTSWADMGELLGAATLFFLLVIAGFLLLLSRG